MNGHKFFYILTTLMIFGSWAPVNAQVSAPISCKYNEVDGTPTALYLRVEAGPTDWYSGYKLIQFCSLSNGGGSYVLIQEELIRNFKVLNPPQAILSSTTTQGNMLYSIADNNDHHVLLLVSQDQTVLKVAVGAKYETTLKLVWHK